MSQHRQKSGVSGCPSESEIELQVLTRSPIAPPTDFIGSHVRNCAACRAVHEELCSFYDSLLSSLSKPVSNHVIDLAMTIATSGGRGAIYALRRISPATSGKRRSYLCEQVLDSGPKGGRGSLASFKQNTLQDPDLALRAFLPEASKHLLCFLWAEHAQSIRNVQMEFEKLGKVCTTNRCGIAMLARTTLEELDGQVVHTTTYESPNGHLASRSRKIGLLLALRHDEHP